MTVYTKNTFKKLWESEGGGGITFDDIADCAKAWGITNSPRSKSMSRVGNQVLIAAGCEPYFDVESE
ncbi:hypothetical protein [Synechococcus sp. PCC 6312]|uniref:hypothetical protein n=1 Tax=Synechococcus sp. (strain ATCC 27167 / PCC 6312) TaxID=195253 RepID=UPI00029F15B1|nr:hypothetical protein [Synechococcus sp. PCC 6312]AFY61954.1 hypothetical protein Syn6312_2890 [Synechococcus sp. PCC 6312]